ncbi:hypothetical protein DYB28_001993 [Aphanomyces astaci]|uniref:Uncharacterized protein n=1 Tax=Aphanomyces astaci TaxID=112090 RepID=A0A9X8DZM7_APHAT|nr:hypothetical protein DYB28_001993 [Aphanomyces astaci]
MASDQAEKLVQKLQQQLDDTTLQVTRLENALKATHYDKMSSANSVANLEAHVKVLTTELNQLKPKHAAVCQQLADESSNGKHWTKQRQALETELATLQSKCQAVARQLHQQSLANESQRSIDVQAQHASVHSEERVMLRRDNDALQVRVRRLELLRNELDVALRDAQAQGTSWKQQVDHLQDQMTETLHDLAKANAQLNQVKMEVVHLQQDKTQLETQVADSRREIEKLAHMAPHEATAKLQESKWQKRVTEAVLSKQLVETQLSAAVAAKAGLEQRLAQAETKLRSADDRAFEINAKVSSLESELANVHSELASSKQSKLYFEAEYEAAMLAWTDQSKAFQTAQHDLDAADGAQRESARQIHDLQAALTALQTETSELSRRVVQLEQNNGQLKHLVGEMECGRDKWSLEHKQLKMDMNDLRESNGHLEGVREQLEASIGQLKQSLSQVRSMLEASDRDKDALIHMLDVKTEEMSALVAQSTRVSEQQSALRNELGSCQASLRQLEAALADKEATVTTLQANLDKADNMSARLKEDVELGRGEHVALTQDLHHMTIENQSLAGECAQLHHEIGTNLQDVVRERDAAAQHVTDLDMQVQVNLTQIKQLTQQLQQLQGPYYYCTRFISWVLLVYSILDKQLSTVRSHEMLSGALSSQHAVATELAQDRVESAATNSSLNQRLASLQAQ